MFFSLIFFFYLILLLYEQCPCPKRPTTRIRIHKYGHSIKLCANAIEAVPLPIAPELAPSVAVNAVAIPFIYKVAKPAEFPSLVTARLTVVAVSAINISISPKVPATFLVR